MSAWPPPALLLTAGLGTRLRPLTLLRAKPALPVGDQTLAGRILSGLGSQGIRDAVLNLHHLPATAARAVGDGGGTGVRVRYSWEQPRLLGSAGGIRHALPLLDGDTILVVNGDTLCDVPLRMLVEAHVDSGALVTMGLIPHPAPGRYGGVRLENGRVTGFPGRAAQEPTWHYPGIQVIQRQVFDGLPDGVPMESVREVYPGLMAACPDAIRGCVFDATFRDIGTIADYMATCGALAGDDQGNVCAAESTVAPDAVLTGTVVWADGRVEAGCRLARCVVTDGAVVPAGTIATDQVFLRRP
jgi:mannose-1-phosphate guanylyltransferase